MENVSRVTCINSGGFVQEFRVCWDGGYSRWSGKYTNPQSRQIDLHDYNLPEGMEVWVEVHAILGKSKLGSTSFIHRSLLMPPCTALPALFGP